jgi:hypothetical protein
MAATTNAIAKIGPIHRLLCSENLPGVRWDIE